MYRKINIATFFVITYEIIDSTFIDIVLASFLTLKNKTSYFLTESGERLGLIIAIFSVFLIILKIYLEISISLELNKIQKDLRKIDANTPKPDIQDKKKPDDKLMLEGGDSESDSSFSSQAAS